MLLAVASTAVFAVMHALVRQVASSGLHAFEIAFFHDGAATHPTDGKYDPETKVDAPLEFRILGNLNAVPEPALYARPRRFFRHRLPKELNVGR